MLPLRLNMFAGFVIRFFARGKSVRLLLAWLTLSLVTAFLCPRPVPAGTTTQTRDGNLIRILVWDEQSPEEKPTYDHYLGNAIADYLKTRPDFSVRSVSFSDPDQGLSDDVLNHCDVLVYWSHFHTNPAVHPAKARQMVQMIRDGKFSMVTLHSAHWSAPFVEAMRWRAAEDALESLPPEQRNSALVSYITPKRFVAPKADAPLTPSVQKTTDSQGRLHVQITLPNCCFPAWRADGAPSHVTTLLADHPIAAGIPLHWDIAQTEMYDEPFHVPAPDAVIFEEKWDKGEHFRSGCLWNIGKGKVFYFRPGHETFPVFKQQLPLRVIENACRWMGQLIRDGETSSSTGQKQQ